jgi:hypothetical protein
VVKKAPVAAPPSAAGPSTPTAGDREVFLTLSSVLTGFSPLELRGTGNAEPLLDFLWTLLGPDICGELLTSAAAALAPIDEAERERAIRATLWTSPKLGPVVQALVRLWYTGKWNPLPAQWQETYRWDHPDPHASAVNLSPQAYIESLVFAAIDAHPPGAKPGGHGSWAYPPAAAPAAIPLAVTT